MREKYVLNLIEDGTFGTGEGTEIGYWDGKAYTGEDVTFPGVVYDKHDSKVKSYTSKKRAENAVKKLKEKFTYVSRAKIEPLD
jgi:hypothetical protein